MKKILILLICSVFFFSCSEDADDKINGFWQLKTVTDKENNTVSKVDTVFYAFQKKVLFSYTLLTHDDLENFNVSYGYVSFPSEREVQIILDESSVFPDFLSLTEWEDYKVTFTIESVGEKNLILTNANKIYSFRRY